MRALLIAAVLAARGAETPADEAELRDIRLSELLDGANSDTLRRLEDLLARLDAMDALHGETAYWLAHARLVLGDLSGATEALALALEDPETREPALALQAQMDAMQRAVDRLPFRATMEDGRGPFVHSWLHGDRGELEVAPVDADHGRAVRWSSRVRDRLEDQITLSFAAGVGTVRQIRFLLKGDGFPAFLRVLVEDAGGREFASDPFEVPTDRWTPVDLAIDALHSTDPTTPSARPRLPLRAVHLHDVTAYLSADRGVREVWIDNVEIR